MKEKIQEFGGWAEQLTRMGLEALKEYHYKDMVLYAIESVEGTTYYLKKGEEIKKYPYSHRAVAAFCDAAWEEMS